MIDLGSSQSLQGLAATAAEVTYTVTGAATGGNPDVLGQGQLGTGATVIYEAPADGAQIVSAYLFNGDAEAQGVYLYIDGPDGLQAILRATIPSGGSAVYESGAGWTVYDFTGAPIGPVENDAAAVQFLIGEVTSGTPLTFTVPAGYTAVITDVEWFNGTSGPLSCNLTVLSDDVPQAVFANQPALPAGQGAQWEGRVTLPAGQELEALTTVTGVLVLVSGEIRETVAV